ncbi:MAG: hypothetical protein LBF41_06580 [Deltaproteobacteria bacterium]|jgi:hypothetical protein|nr:hypothetical protein [Deltaproteobacteria bacterium]
MPQLLHVTDTSDFYPESRDGITICQIYGLLFQLLKTEVSEDAALVLAEPVERPREGSVAWHTSLEGKVQKLEELNPEESREVHDLMCRWAASFASCSAKLMVSPSGQRKLAGKLISKLATAIAGVLAGVGGASEVYAVGGKPVLCAWGMAPVSGSKGAGLSKVITVEQREKIQSILAGVKPEFKGFVPPPPPSPPEPVRTGESTTVPDPVSGEGFRTIPVPVSRAAEEDGRGLPWFPLSAFLAFLATLLLFFLLVPGMRELPLAAGAEDRERELLLEQRKEGELKRERDILRNGYFAALALCPTGTAAPPAASPPRASRPPVGPAASRPPVGPAEELVIPETGEDLSFLEGCWISDANLVSKLNSLPVIYKYCFNESGEAKVTVDQYDSDGAYKDTCLATGVAVKEGASVTIADSGPSCPGDSLSYTPTTVTCETPAKGAPAVCWLQSRGGEKFDSIFTYAGKN